MSRLFLLAGSRRSKLTSSVCASLAQERQRSRASQWASDSFDLQSCGLARSYPAVTNETRLLESTRTRAKIPTSVEQGDIFLLNTRYQLSFLQPKHVYSDSCCWKHVSAEDRHEEANSRVMLLSNRVIAEKPLPCVVRIDVQTFVHAISLARSGASVDWLVSLNNHHEDELLWLTSRSSSLYTFPAALNAFTYQPTAANTKIEAPSKSDEEREIGGLLAFDHSLTLAIGRGMLSEVKGIVKHGFMDVL